MTARSLFRLAACGTLGAFLLLSAAPAHAQWSADPESNLALASRPAGQAQPKLAATPDGGFYVSWFGGGGDGFDVYLQRLDAAGVPQWAEGGIRVADRDFSSTQDYGLALGAGGEALLAFRYQDPSGVVRAAAARISPQGAPLWGAPGLVYASPAEGAVASPRIAPMPDGGAAVAWTSMSTGALVVQRLSASGERLWGEGVSLSTPTGTFFIADLHAHDDGSVIVSGSAQLSFSDRRLWAQKLSASGAPLWGDAPVQVFNGSDGALQLGNFPTFLPDGSGGAVFAWYQVGMGTASHVRVQRVLSSGALAFPQNGVDAVTGTARQRSAPAVTFDAATGDVYVVFPESEQVTSTERHYGVTAQRVDATGARRWGAAGRAVVPLAATPTAQVTATLAGNGPLFAWAFAPVAGPIRYEAARYDADGVAVWPAERLAFKTAPTHAARLQARASTEGFTAFAWTDGPTPEANASLRVQNVRLDGRLGQPIPPQASVEPDVLSITVSAGGTESAMLTLSNGAGPGADSLAFTAAVLQEGAEVVDFEDGENPYAFTFGIPAADHIPQSGGNPGRWFRNSALQTFAVRLYMPDVPGSPFVGDYAARGVREITVDAQTVSVGLGVQGRPFTLRFVRHNGEPTNPEAHDYVYLPGPLVPQPGEGWRSYTFPIPSDYDGTMPEGWGGGYYGDPENLPPGVTFGDVIRSVDEAELVWGHPAFFYLLQSFDVGVDNVRIAFDDPTPGPVTVSPDAGSVPAGEGQVLTVTASGLSPGTHAFTLQIETDDPETPVISVPVAVTVSGVSAEPEGGAPPALALLPNYPNPFVGATTLTFELPEPSRVALEVYDLTGRLAASLLDADLPSGAHRLRWDASGLAAGPYLVRLRSGDAARTLPVLLLPAGAGR